MRSLLLSSCFLVLAGPLFASSSDRGTTGGQFLKVAPGARPSAMGEAFAGVADDVNTIYYNPAGLGTLRKVEVTGMHDSYLQGFNYEYGAIAVPMLAWTSTKLEKNRYGTLGAAIYNLNVGGIERRSINETDEPTDTFSSNDFAYAVAYGLTIPDTGLSLGVSLKGIDETLDSAHASAVAVDAGALYRTGKLGLGAGLRNMGTSTRFTTVADPLPLTAFLGAGYKFNDNWIGSLEVDIPRDNNTSVGLGGEYRQLFADKITGALRAGYTTRNSDAGGLAGATLGLGVGFGGLSFDFAFVPFGELGNTYKYSLTAKF